METTVVFILAVAAVLFIAGMAIYRLMKGPEGFFRSAEPAHEDRERQRRLRESQAERERRQDNVNVALERPGVLQRDLPDADQRGPHR